MGSGTSACWGGDVSTIGFDVSTLGVGAATSGKCTLGDCTAVFGLCTLGGGGVRGMQLFCVGGMQYLRRFPRSIIVFWLHWHCGKLGRVGPLFEELPEFCDRS